jgi:hypothetical protein
MPGEYQTPTIEDRVIDVQKKTPAHPVILDRSLRPRTGSAP